MASNIYPKNTPELPGDSPAYTPESSNVLDMLKFYQVRQKDYLHAMVGGLTGTGKTRLILTAPKPCLAIIAERNGGDVDLRDKEGIIPVYLNPKEIERDAFKILDLVTSPEGQKTLGLQSVYVDNLTYIQNWMFGEIVRTNNKGYQSKVPGDATERNYGWLAARMKPFLQALFSLEAHVIINVHIKSEEVDLPPVFDGGARIVRKQKIWYPDLTPAILSAVDKEVALMGYTYRSENPPVGDVEQDDSFFVSFKSFFRNRQRDMIMQNAKSPSNWGHKEPPDVTNWIERLAAEKNMNLNLRKAA